MRVAQTNEPCAIESSLGKGSALVIGCDYPYHSRFFEVVMARMGAVPRLRQDSPEGGIVLTSVTNREKERFVTALNLDDQAKKVRITDGGESLFGSHQLILGGRQGRLMPVNVRFGAALVNFSTAELTYVSEHELRFRGSGTPEVAGIQCDRYVAAIGATALRTGDLSIIRSNGGPFSVAMR